MTARTSRFTALASSLVLLGALLACKKKPTHEPLSFKANPQTAVGKYYTLTVNGAKECDIGKAHLKPRKGYVHLAVDMIYEATTDERVGLMGYELELKDRNGGSYKTSLGQCAPELETGRYVQKHNRLSGLVTFEVPETTSELVLYLHEFHNPSLGSDETSMVLSR